MQQPKVYVKSSTKHLVYKLRKTFYGLKCQSPYLKNQLYQCKDILSWSR